VFSYILKRLFLLLPTLILISIVAFILSKNTPQDTVGSVLAMRGIESEGLDDGLYKSVYKELGLDKANFYFSIVPNNYPESLNIYYKSGDQNLAKRLLKAGYGHNQVQSLFESYEGLREKFSESSDSEMLIALEKSKSNVDDFLNLVDLSKTVNPQHSLYYPSFKWHGTTNQYHAWLMQALTEEFGPSISDGKTALSKVSKALKWTLSFTLIDFLLSIVLGLFIGLFLSIDPENRKQKIVRQILYFFYAIPVFWLATMFLIYFTTDDYGKWTNIFPSVGIDLYPGKSTFQQIFLNFDKLLLPILCLTLHSLAYVSRMIESSILDELKKDYVLMAYAKGISKKKILYTQVLKNAMTPSITMFMSSLAAAFSGSLVLEVIYGIPGMGRLMYNALLIADWNVVFCILMTLSLVTIIAYLIGDVLYALFNPKVRFQS